MNKQIKKIKKDNIHILGIETSCDDTCASVVCNGSEILSNIVSSQNEIHLIGAQLATARSVEGGGSL